MPTSRTKTGRPARASAHHPKSKPPTKAKATAKAKPKTAPERPAPKAARPPSPKPTAAPPPAPAKGGVKAAAGAMLPPAGAARPGAVSAPGKPGLPGKLGALTGKPVVPGKPAAGTGKPGARPSAKKGGRKSPLSQRRGPNGELFQPGDLLLPTGPQGPDEIQYLLRGSVAAEHPAPEAGVSEIVTKKGPEAEGDRGELGRFALGLAERFDSGTIEPLLPTRPVGRRNFAGVVERAKHRRREIGAFLRGQFEKN